MQLGPGLDQALFAAVQATLEDFDLIDCHHHACATAIGMEMWAMVGTARFREHAHHDSKKSADFGHPILAATPTAPVGP